MHDGSPEGHIYTAKIAEQIQQYEYMLQNLILAIKIGGDLEIYQLNLLKVALKNIVALRRKHCKALTFIIQQQKDPKNINLAKSLKRKIECEIHKYCNIIISLIEEQQKKTSKFEKQVFFWRLKGDCYMRIAEYSQGEMKQKAAQNAQEVYLKFKNQYESQMKPTDPIRLETKLNYSVFTYEILIDKKRAFSISKQALDEAIEYMDSPQGQCYKQTTFILQIIRDNLTIWGQN